MKTHYLIRLNDGTEDCIPYQYLFLKKSLMRSKGEDKWDYTYLNGLTNYRTIIDKEQYEHILSFLSSE